MTSTVLHGAPDGADTAAAPVIRPVWRRVRWWLALVAAVLLGAVLVTSVSSGPSRPLDPGSAHKDGSKALARLLTRYGSPVHTLRTLESAVHNARHATVVVTAPDDYSGSQLRRLHAAAKLTVLVRPGQRALSAIAPGVETDPKAAPSSHPGCADTGARAAGDIALPGDYVTYTGAAQSCYGGLLVTVSKVAVLGSAALLRDDQLARQGIAALAVNTISADRSGTPVRWLLPGSDAAGPGPATVWQLFPDGAHRVFWWLLALGVLVVLWRARRLGAVVSEPLPVVVRAVEVVEGHGRLYLRAGARDRAAVALQGAATVRLTARLGQPRGATAEQVAVAAAAIARRPPAETVSMLAGGLPADDTGLLRLAAELDRLEAAVRAATGEGNGDT